MNAPTRLAPPIRPRERSEGGLSLSVVLLNEWTTVPALNRAAELAYDLGARIRIIAPHVVPYHLPIERPDVDPEFRVRRFLNLSIESGLDLEIDVRLCRDLGDGLTQALRPQSVVLIGIGKRYWPTRESRLAKRLRRAGHHVILVAQN